jgi:hypothetical protein
MLSKRVRWRLIGFDASLRRGTLREQPLEHAPREPDHAAVLADLDPDFHRLPIGVPAGVLGKADWETAPLALSYLRKKKGTLETAGRDAPGRGSGDNRARTK